MTEHIFEPKNGFTQVLHWDGPGWYGGIGSQDATHTWRYAGEWDKDGFSRDPDAEVQRIWDARESLGTPFYLASVEDFAGEGLRYGGMEA